MNRLRRRLARIGAPVRVCLSACVYEPDPERRRLRQMLDSTAAAGTTDYAIAVDRKSTLGTVGWIRWHLFRRRGLVASLLRPARVVEFTWQDDFAHARNVALDLVPAECDWLYAIDNDDVLEQRDGRSLPEVLAELPPTCRVLRIPYIVPDRHGEAAAESMYETFFRGPVTYRWKRAWGETLQPIDRSGGGSLCSSDFVRRHDRDWSINRRRGGLGSRNYRIIRKALDDDPTDQGLWAFWGQCCGGLLDWESAAASWERALSLCTYTRARLGLVPYLMTAYTFLGRLDRVRELGALAREWHPERPEPYFFDGRARMLSGDCRAAIEAIAAGLARLDVVATLEGRTLHTCLPTGPWLYDCEPYVVLSECYGQLGEFAQALRQVERALSGHASKLVVAHLNLRRAFYERGEIPPAIGELLPQVWAASRAALERIRSYPTLEHVIADLDSLMPVLTADGVDLEYVCEVAEQHFAERLELDQSPLGEVAA